MKERGPAFVGASLLLLLVALAMWQARHAADAKGAAAMASAGADTRADRRATPDAAPSRVTAARVAGPASGRRSTDPTAHWQLDATTTTPSELEDCGLGAALFSAAPAEAARERAIAKLADAGTRLFEPMVANADPQVRAAGLLAMDEREALAAMARLTDDATVYAMALQACLRGGSDGRPAACETLSADQQARLDPDNAAAWIHVAAQAAQRKDDAGVAEALHRASLARFARAREWRFADMALSMLPPEWPQRDAVLAATVVTMVHGSLAQMPYSAVQEACSKQRQQADVNRLQTCERLANVLTEHGETTMDLVIGNLIGRHAGWSAERVERNQARFAAYIGSLQGVEASGGSRGAGSTTNACQALRHQVRTMQAVSRDGEVGHAQANLDRLGLDDAALVQRYRAQRAREQRPAAASGPR